MTDPFAPVESKETVVKKVLAAVAKAKPEPVADPRTELTDKDIYYNQIDERGNVCKYKVESGVPVKVADLGNIKDVFNHAIQKAAMMSPDQLETVEFGDLTHIEIAAIKLACFAAAGDLKATQELFDRVLGKAKQVSESMNLNLTIDDVLNGIQAKEEIVDV